MGVIQRRRAADSVSTLRNDVKRSVLEKQDGANISRLCYHYGPIKKFKETERRVKFKDGLPYLFHSFRNKYFNKISLGNMLNFQNKL